MLFFSQATCVVCSPEFVKLFEELAPSLPTLQYIIHFDKHQPSLPDGDSLPAPAPLGTGGQQHQVSLSLPSKLFVAVLPDSSNLWCRLGSRSCGSEASRGKEHCSWPRLAANQITPV
jgi:hypothetical protein